jgi:kynurenine formamidase
MTDSSASASPIPRYSELLQRTDAPPGSSWGIFGKDDEVGMVNFITPECVRYASKLVRRGVCFNLDKSLDAFDPPVARHRHKPRHHMFCNSPDHRDDYIDNFYLQGTTQVDSLRHFRHPDYGFYNGARDEDIKPGSPTIGVNRYAERCIVGRGVLIDIERYLSQRGRSLDHKAGEAFPVRLLDDVAAAQRVKFMPGDILLMRTGWMACYFNDMTPQERILVPTALKSTGLLQAPETVEWLWDHRISVGASDNAGFEAIPSSPSSPFVSKRDRAAGSDPIHAGLMHPTLIALMGLCLGELWDLEALAADCAETGVYECMVTCKPLNITGGVGSPANAIAIV